MTLFGTLGTIEFELISSPTSLRFSQDYNFAEHARIEGKPTLQKVGGNLATVDMTLRLHRQFCDPQTELGKLELAGFRSKTMKLIVGDEVYGDFIITGLDVTVQKLATGVDSLLPDKLAIASCEVNLKLKEWIGLPVEQEKEKEKDDAPIKQQNNGFPRKTK